MSDTRGALVKNAARAVGTDVETMERMIESINWATLTTRTEGEKIRDRINARLKGKP